MAPCLCAPTNHPGSFRCRLHRSIDQSVGGDQESWGTDSQTSATAPCLCAPTSHPGSFRCRLHRTKEQSWGGRPLRVSAQAKGSRASEPASAKSGKSGDSVIVKKIAFARTNRMFSEAQLRCELNKAMVAGQGVPEVSAAVEELRIAPVENVTKKSKIIVAPVPGTATLRPLKNDQENAAQTDVAKGPKEATLRSQLKAVKKPCTAREQRLRAKSDVLASLL